MQLNSEDGKNRHFICVQLPENCPSDIIEKANRATPHENDVPGHKQRYHTKDGVVWRYKAPYHRGGKVDK